LLEALALLHELSAAPPAPNEPAPFARARIEAAALSTSLEQRIPSLRLDLSGSPDRATTQLTVDGVPRPDCSSECRLNPGRHVIAARTAKALAEEQVRLAERETSALELVFSPLTAPRGNARAAPLRGSAPPTRVPTATWVGSGVALVGVAAGAWLGVSAVNERNRLRRDCAPDCAQADVDEVRRRAAFANVSFGIALAGAALAATSYLMARSHTSESPTRPNVAKPVRLRLAAAPTLVAPGGVVQVGATF
jgi:hypothetical protein